MTRAREHPGGHRFTLARSETGEDIVRSDDWQDILAALAHIQPEPGTGVDVPAPAPHGI